MMCGPPPPQVLVPSRCRIGIPYSKLVHRRFAVWLSPDFAIPKICQFECPPRAISVDETSRIGSWSIPPAAHRVAQYPWQAEGGESRAKSDFLENGPENRGDSRRKPQQRKRGCRCANLEGTLDQLRAIRLQMANFLVYRFQCAADKALRRMAAEALEKYELLIAYALCRWFHPLAAVCESI